MIRNGRLLGRASVGCGVVCLSLAAFAAATYDVSSQPGDLIVTVDVDGATLDAEQVTQGVTNIIKRGAGDLMSVELSSYQGDFTVDEGCLLYADRYTLGADNVGTVYVNDGATLRPTQAWGGWGDSVAKGKKFIFSGQPAVGYNGKICRLKADYNGSGQCWVADNSVLTFLDDSAIDMDAQRLKIRGTVDLGGHTLDLVGRSGWQQFQGDFMVTNGGHVVYRATADGYSYQCEGGKFGFYPSENPCSLTVSNATYEARNSLDVASASLNLDRASFYATPHRLKEDTTTSRWTGPVTLSNAVKLATYATRTNVLSIAGGIGGTGTLTVGPGWLNLIGAHENGYAGAVTVTAADGGIAHEHSGIGLHDGANLFTNASSVVFQNGANLMLNGAAPHQLGQLSFTGDADAVLEGGNPAFGGQTRSTATGLVKSGSGTLCLNGAVHVAGTVDLQGGTLRLPPRIFGHAGLMEGMYVDMSKGDASGQGIWCSTGDKVDEKIPVDKWTYSRLGAAKIFNGYPNVVSNGFTRATACCYKGYLWNRNETNETWRFAMHMSYRILMRVNDEWTPWNGSGEAANRTNIWSTVVKPGANPILVYSLGANWQTRQDPSPRFDGLALSYSRLSDPATTNAADFVRLDDGGSGELLTVDLAGGEVAPDMLPVFDVLACAPAATLDVNGNDFVQGELVGFPVLANVGSLTIGRKWSVAKDDVAAGKALVSDGPLAFADGATILVTGEDKLAVPASREYVIARAPQVSGTPTIDPASSYSPKWKIVTTETEVKLVKEDLGLMIFIR